MVPVWRAAGADARRLATCGQVIGDILGMVQRRLLEVAAVSGIRIAWCRSSNPTRHGRVDRHS
jgi:orotate phosphoribosyltransferase-like protein